jgi:hypothetical protein
MGLSNTSEHVACIWMKIQELHGIKSPRDIQKTKPKLIAIAPTLIAIPYGPHGHTRLVIFDDGSRGNQQHRVAQTVNAVLQGKPHRFKLKMFMPSSPDMDNFSSFS